VCLFTCIIRKRLNEPTQKGSKVDELNFAKFEVLTTVFWNFTPCSFTDIFRCVRRIAESDYSLRRLSVRPNWTTGPQWADLHEIWLFLENLSIKFRFHSNLTRLTGST
jgi:hypothetical protein